jgi:RNA polymerase sigma-70 factor (ECF subfamily)
MPSLPDTRASLLLRLPNAEDVAAWDEFAAVYAPLVYRLARRRGLQPADADDLVQEVLAAVARAIDGWLKNPGRGPFRAWLLRIARNLTINFLTRAKYRPLAAGGSDAAGRLANHTADLEASSQFDLEYRREVFRWAAEQVRESVAERTWEAFWETSVEDQPAEAVARQLGMSVGSVYIAKSRVMSRLREVVKRMEAEENHG